MPRPLLFEPDAIAPAIPAIASAASALNFFSSVSAVSVSFSSSALSVSVTASSVVFTSSEGYSFPLFSVSAIANGACTKSNESAVANEVFVIGFIFMLPK